MVTYFYRKTIQLGTIKPPLEVKRELGGVTITTALGG